MRRLRLLAALAVLLGLLTPLGSSAADGCVRANQGDSWERYTAPPDLQQDLRALAVQPGDAGRVWVTDGQQVQRTVDAGCEWRIAFQSSGTGFVLVNSFDPKNYITQLLVTGDVGRETTWVVDQGFGQGGARVSEVFVATGGSDSFSQSFGLPGTGDVLLAVGVVPSRAYAIVTSYQDIVISGEDDDTDPLVRSALWVTSDTGTTWSRVGDLPDGFHAVGAAITPKGDFLTWSKQQLLRATDGGVPRKVALAGKGIAAVSATNTVAVVPETGPTQISLDGGATFTSHEVLPGVRAITEIPGTPAYGLLLGTKAVVWVPGAGQSDVSPRKLALLGLAGAKTSGGKPALVGYGRADVLALPLTSSARPVTPPLPLPPVDVKVVAPGIRPPPVSALVPASTDLVLQPGQRKRVDYQLTLPPVPGPLDVYFLMDTTGSMQPSIDGLRESIQSIVDALASSRLDVQMGLGDFRDVDEAVGGYVYRRDAAIAPPGEALARGLERLTIGGGGDAPEADTIALSEAVTGKGRTGLVPPGQDAGFRVDSTQVIVLVTDAPMHVETPVYPTFQEVAKTLGPVRVLGIAVGPYGLDDLKRVARDTHGFAPAEGLDCDGDSAPDVAAGQPAVCQVGSGGRGGQQLGQAIISLLQGVAQPGRVRVDATGPAVAGVVGAVDRVLDLARPQHLAFAVDFACGKDDAGKTLTADLAATASGRRVIGSAARVRCAGPPAPKPPPAPAPPRPQPVAAVLVPPAAPPAPAQVPQAQPATNPQPGPVTNPNLMAAAVDQQQEQLELVLAQQEIEQLEELAMVGRPSQDEQAAALRVLAVAALMTSVAGGVRLRSRHRDRQRTRRALVRVEA